jgi:chromosome segregation ATPase
MATEVRKTAKVQWELRKTQGALREAKEALQEAHRETDMAKDELGGAEKELAALRPQKGVLTKGDCALILGDKWAKENLGEIKDRLNMAREPAPPEWAELAKKKIQEETRANQKSSPAPRPGG